LMVSPQAVRPPPLPSDATVLEGGAKQKEAEGLGRWRAGVGFVERESEPITQIC